MADKVEKEVVPSETNGAAAVKTTNKPLIISLVVAGVVGIIMLIALVSAITLGIAGRHVRTQAGVGPLGGARFEQQMPAQRRGAFGGGRMQADSDTFVSGVVTAVNGDTITVSGDGKQVTVTKNSSTTIRGTASSVAVNDTVSITGTTTNGTFTATTITIRNL
jgi:hypothetical protein